MCITSSQIVSNQPYANPMQTLFCAYIVLKIGYFL